MVVKMVRLEVAPLPQGFGSLLAGLELSFFTIKAYLLMMM